MSTDTSPATAPASARSTLKPNACPPNALTAPGSNVVTVTAAGDTPPDPAANSVEGDTDGDGDTDANGDGDADALRGAAARAAGAAPPAGAAPAAGAATARTAKGTPATAFAAAPNATFTDAATGSDCAAARTCGCGGPANDLTGSAPPGTLTRLPASAASLAASAAAAGPPLTPPLKTSAKTPPTPVTLTPTTIASTATTATPARPRRGFAAVPTCRGANERRDMVTTDPRATRNAPGRDSSRESQHRRPSRDERRMGTARRRRRARPALDHNHPTDTRQVLKIASLDHEASPPPWRSTRINQPYPATPAPTGTAAAPPWLPSAWQRPPPTMGKGRTAGQGQATAQRASEECTA